MRRSRSIVALAAVTAVGALLPHASAAPAPKSVVRAMVSFKGDIPNGFERELSRLGVSQAMGFESIDTVAFTGPAAVLRRLARDPRVREARLQRKIQLHMYQSNKQIGSDQAGTPATYPNPDGSIATRPAVDGTGATVAILDSGVFLGHPDLQSRVVKSLNFEFSWVGRDQALFTPAQRDSYSSATGSSAIADGMGHGTHVAGTIAGTGAMAPASRPNKGVAPGAKIVSMKIADAHQLGTDVGWEANAVAAFDWLLRHGKDAEFGPNGIGVNSNSWGLLDPDAFGPINYDAMIAVVRKVVGAGITTVFSAGNDGGTPANPSVRAVPNGMPEVITVAAACKPDSGTSGCTKITDPAKWNTVKLASFSSRGAAVDITAPGVEIMSTVSPSALAPLGHALYGGNWGATPQEQAQNRAFYMSLSGTSMSGPHIAGVVALLKSVNPALTPAQVHSILTSTADDRGTKIGPDAEWGYGMVNVPKALIAAHKLIAAAG